MLEATILDQVRSIFQPLEARYTFHITCNPEHEQAGEMIDFLNNIASCSDKLSCQVTKTDEPKLEFTLLKEGEETGIKFRAVPGGHEFSSLLLAVLNADGKGKNLPDEGIGRRIKALQGPIHLQTYVSLACTNCPDIVQALNAVALLHPHITHDTIDGAIFQEEADALKIQAVPSVYANGKQLHVGTRFFRGTPEKTGRYLRQLPQKCSTRLKGVRRAGPGRGSCRGFGSRLFRPQRIARSHYCRTNRRTGKRNRRHREPHLRTPDNRLAQLADALRTHIEHYPIEIFEDRKIEKAELQGKEKKVFSGGGETFTALAVIIATGASWRKLNVEGEAEYLGRGVAFCPHCDGPFYQGKHVAVIGGGNSGIEAAIDLAGISQESYRLRVCRYAKSRPGIAGKSRKPSQRGDIHFFTNHPSDGRRRESNRYPHQRPHHQRGARLSFGRYLRTNRSGSQQRTFPGRIGNDTDR